MPGCFSLTTSSLNGGDIEALKNLLPAMGGFKESRTVKGQRSMTPGTIVEFLKVEDKMMRDGFA